jgi:hypothetical protein
VEDKKLQEELTSNKTKKVAQTPKEQKSKGTRLESAKQQQRG